MAWLSKATEGLSKLGKDVDAGLNKVIKEVESSKVMQDANKIVGDVQNSSQMQTLQRKVSDVSQQIEASKVYQEAKSTVGGVGDTVSRAAEKATAAAEKEYHKKCIESLQSKFGIASYQAAIEQRWEDVTMAANTVKLEVDGHLAKIQQLDARIAELDARDLESRNAASASAAAAAAAASSGSSAQIVAVDDDGPEVVQVVQGARIDPPVAAAVEAVPVGRPVEPVEAI